MKRLNGLAGDVLYLEKKTLGLQGDVFGWEEYVSIVLNHFSL